MSLGRFFQEFQPLFRALDEPFRSPYYYPRAGRAGRSAAPFDDPFFTQVSTVRPAVDVHEENNTYRVEAELPGVPRENVNVSVGEGGQSLTIEGSVSVRRTERPGVEGPETTTTVSKGADGPSKEVAKKAEGALVSNQLASERTFVGNTSFTRTVWLPTPVDTKSVSAKLQDGILTVTLQKVTGQAVKVNVE